MSEVSPSEKLIHSANDMRVALATMDKVLEQHASAVEGPQLQAEISSARSNIDQLRARLDIIVTEAAPKDLPDNEEED